jgi:hypothetical protein
MMFNKREKPQTKLGILKKLNGEADLLAKKLDPDSPTEKENTPSQNLNRKERTLRFLEHMEQREKQMQESLENEHPSFKEARRNYDIRFIHQKMKQQKEEDGQKETPSLIL